MNKLFVENYEINLSLYINNISLLIFDKKNNKKCFKIFNENDIIIKNSVFLNIDEIYNYCINTDQNKIKIINENDFIYFDFNDKISFITHITNFFDLYQEMILNKIESLEKMICNNKKYEINILPNISFSHIVITWLLINSVERIVKIIYK
jgi:hypothetical protein